MSALSQSRHCAACSERATTRQQQKKPKKKKKKKKRGNPTEYERFNDPSLLVLFLGTSNRSGSGILLRKRFFSIGRPTGAKDGLDGGDSSLSSEIDGVPQDGCTSSPSSVINRGIRSIQDIIAFFFASKSCMSHRKRKRRAIKGKESAELTL